MKRSKCWKVKDINHRCKSVDPLVPHFPSQAKTRQVWCEERLNASHPPTGDSSLKRTQRIGLHLPITAQSVIARSSHRQVICWNVVRVRLKGWVLCYPVEVMNPLTMLMCHSSKKQWTSWDPIHWAIDNSTQRRTMPVLLKNTKVGSSDCVILGANVRHRIQDSESSQPKEFIQF